MSQLQSRDRVESFSGDGNAVVANQVGGDTQDSCGFGSRNAHTYREILGIFRDKLFVEKVWP